MRYRVVLALEDVATREFYSSSLASAGYDVLTCSPGLAVRMASSRHADAVVIDGSRVRGVSACEEFKSHPAMERIPLIALAPPGSAAHFDPLCDVVLPVDCLPGPLVDAVDRLLTRPHSR